MSLITVREASLLMTSNPMLCALQFAYEGRPFKENFDTLKELILQTPKTSIVLAPELCLSAYAYDNLDAAANFSATILPYLAELSTCKTIGLTLVEKIEEHYVNNFKLFHQGTLIYTRSKVKLFPLGKEEHYFQAGMPETIELISLNGIKIAVLICFELRFPSLWEQIKGADIILVPAYWGKERKAHLNILVKALAIANQAYVVCANSADETMAKNSAIISPFGESLSDDRKSLLMQRFDTQTIKKMRRYLNVGLDTNASIGSF